MSADIRVMTISVPLVFVNTFLGIYCFALFVSGNMPSIKEIIVHEYAADIRSVQKGV